MSEKKWVLIGPVFPYKGGISHYTGLMYKSIAAKHPVEMISYKMQYPKILFRKEQRDYSNDAFKVENTKFLLNTANPFNIIATARKIVKLNPEKVIIQWWHPYFAPCYRILTGILKKHNIKIVFVCHNVFPHERFPMDRKLTRMALKAGDEYILHAKGEVEDLLSIKPSAKIKVRVHPTYSVFNFDNLTVDEARKKLGIDSDVKVVLFFGFVREYKGLKHLLKAFFVLKNEFYVNDKMPRLLVVGDFGENKEEYLELIKNYGIEDCIAIVDGYIPDKEVEKYFSASNLVALPYESATQSGIVQIAYGFKKPVIVTNVGGLPEVVENNVTGTVVEPRNAKALAKAIYEFFEENRGKSYVEGIEKYEYKFSWDRMREALEEDV